MTEPSWSDVVDDAVAVVDGIAAGVVRQIEAAERVADGRRVLGREVTLLSNPAEMEDEHGRETREREGFGRPLCRMTARAIPAGRELSRSSTGARRTMRCRP